MTSNNKYTILPTSTFKEELEGIMYYIRHKLKEPLTAKKFYKKVVNEIKSLKFMPERYKIIEEIHARSKILRKTSVNNYIIIYEVDNNTRTSFHSTYFS